MKGYKLTVTHSGHTKEIYTNDNDSLLAALRNADYEVAAPCGGNGTCKQCKIYVTGTVFALANPEELIKVSDDELLACRYQAASDCSIMVPESKKMEIVTTGAGKINPCGDGLGVAVDIGTTTVAAFLYDLKTGELLTVESGRNAQRPYGADVISRIQFSDKEGGLEKLAEAIRKQIDKAIDKMCKRKNRDRTEITTISIAGNTVMEHIYMMLSPVTIGVAPFKTLSLFGESVPASEVFSGLAPNAELYLCPALAGYVGGDITAGLYSSGAYLSEQTCLFLDIGTNGEMGLGDSNGYICCATAAGPAFEGAEIECGMDGSLGAISRVRYENGKIEYDVIGDIEAAGICGSGLVDALASMLRCGAVIESGRMVTPEDAPENIAHHIKRDENGSLRFYLTDKVYVSAEDVRQLQLAKSAIRAGVETLLTLREQKYDDIEFVLLAGGFGGFIDITSACAIGLLPPALVNKTRYVGNAAGAGAALALDIELRSMLTALTDKCSYHELSSSALFMDKYIEAMIFDEAEEVFAATV